jgi:hypothetical protein
MVDKNQIPYLLRLLDDDSAQVRRQVTEQLLSFGPGLEAELAHFDADLSPTQLDALRELLAEHRKTSQWREAWIEWPHLPTVAQRLERAFELLAEFQYGWRPPVSLGEMLDGLAESFASSGREIVPLGLSRYLFITQKFNGNVDEYHHPQNSNLIHVIESRRGIPITLASVFILVGDRLGIDIGGCDVPGHFLARAEVNGGPVLFDCFNRGRVLTAREQDQLRRALTPTHQALLEKQASAEAIIGRVIRNLIVAYEKMEDRAKSEQAGALLADLEARAVE